MRDLDGRMAEIERRSQVRIKQIKKRRIGVLMTCVPVVLCVALIMGVGIKNMDNKAYAPGEALKQEFEEHFSVENNGNVALKDSCDAPETGGTESLLEAVRYIPVDVNGDNVKVPQVTVIGSKETLEDQNVHASTSTEVLAQYGESFFESSYLVLVRIEAGSSAVRYQVTGVKETDDGQIAVTIKRIVPEFETNALTQWDIILELKKDEKTVTEEQVLVEFQ